MPIFDDNGNEIQEMYDDAGNLITKPVTQPVIKTESTKIPNTIKPSPVIDTPVKDESSTLSKLWHGATDPLTDVTSRIARSISREMTDPNHQIMSPTGKGGFHDFAAKALSEVQGFGAGAIEGIGDSLTSMTSPAGLATALVSGGESLALKNGMLPLAQGLNVISKAASLPFVAHGASQTFSPDSTWGERAQGLAEMAGGAAALVGETPTKLPVKSPIPIPTEIPKVATPEVTAPTTTVPITPTPTVASPVKPTDYKIGQTALIKQGEPAAMKKAMEAGWVFDSLTEDNRIRIKYVGKKVIGPILESEVGQTRPTESGARQQLGPATDTKKTNPLVEMANFPRAVMASMDLSAPLRQGLPLWHKWKLNHFTDMAKAWGSEDFFNDAQKEIAEKPLFKKRVGAEGKIINSFAEDAGLKLTDLHDLSSREENLMSTWSETGGNIPFASAAYRSVVGRGVRASNRAYTLFLNKLRADTFESLVKDGKVFGADAEPNLPLARGIADFVNYASGRGSLGKAERAATVLNSTFFAPRLIASRIKILNPWTYINPNTPSFVRKEAIKSLFALATAGNVALQLGKMAGADVSSDPSSADFGKLKIGNVRLDPWAGAQQYIVAANRILRPQDAHIGENVDTQTPVRFPGTNMELPSINMARGLLGSHGGDFKSSTSDSKYHLGEKYGGSTRLDVAGRFGEGKLNPIANFLTTMLRGKDLAGNPFDAPEEVAKRLVPIFLQDFKELLTENPNLIPGYHDKPAYDVNDLHPANLPYAIPSLLGMGMQRYGNE